MYEIDARTKDGFALLMMALGSLFVLDVLSTDLIIQFGGFEYNPAMVLITNNPFWHLSVKLGILAIIGCLVYLAELKIKKSGFIVLFGIVAYYFFVVSWNTAVIAGVI